MRRVHFSKKAMAATGFLLFLLPALAAPEPLPPPAVVEALPALAAPEPLPALAAPEPLPALAAPEPLPALAASEASAEPQADGDDDPNVVYDPELFGAMKYRLIGPYRGGRATAATGVPGEPMTYYFGASGGGVWKTTSGGQSWFNVSDGFFGVGSIGAIAVADSDTNVVYVGTGSACPRGNISVGDGIYKSTDAGRTWKKIGLPEAGQIGRIRVHPTDPELVYVAALGHIFGPNEERGVYRSKDGGQTWEKVLYVSRQAGAVDLAMNPKNPRELYATIWRAERTPWTLIDGGEDSGLYKTTDGGDTWVELTDPELDNGLPTGMLGRIGVTIAPENPDRVWALVTTQENDGLYRSDDAGQTWSRLTGDRRLLTRGWYYSHVAADSRDPDTVYVNNGGFFRSVDGGRTFTSIRTPHGDNHDVWINPDNNRIMVQSNDGGANVSFDAGQNWSSILNQPTAEFYRVTVDNQFPYRVYGAQQDNSTISVPSWTGGGITPQQFWQDVAGGESGHIAVHPDNPDLVYSGNYIGLIDRYDDATGYSRNVIIYPEMQDGTAPRDLKHRFQWNAPIRFSIHDPGVIYHTSNYVHRTRDGGMSWETISPDLTRDEPEKQDLPGGPIQHDHTGVEVFNTIFAFTESPHAAGEFWAGSDGGLVHISRDDGANWTDITPPDMQIDSTVNTIVVSPHRPGRAFLAVHRYRMDDMRPYVYRTGDYGRSWELLTSGSNGIPAHHPVRAIAEDPDREGLLYAGTEFGMFVSFNDGAHWQSLQLNLPVVPVTDLVVHRQDLVVATQGRSFWILDDLTPLHQISDEMASADAWLFEPRTAYRASIGRFRAGTGPEYPREGVTIYYFLAEEPVAAAGETAVAAGETAVAAGEPVAAAVETVAAAAETAAAGDATTSAVATLEILDASGEVIRTFTSAKEGEKQEEGEQEEPFAAFRGGGADPKIAIEAGMNRFVWDLKYPKPELIEGSRFSLAYTGGHYAVPGAYGARLTVGDWSQTRSFEVMKDPRMTEVTQADLEAQFDLVVDIREALEEIHGSIKTLRSVREQLRSVAARVEDAGYEGNWKEDAEAIAEKLGAIEEDVIQHRAKAGSDLLNFPPRLDDQFAYLYSHVYGAYGRPTQGAYERLEDLKVRWEPYRSQLQQILETEVAAFNEALVGQGVPSIVVVQ